MLVISFVTTKKLFITTHNHPKQSFYVWRCHVTTERHYKSTETKCKLLNTIFNYLWSPKKCLDNKMLSYWMVVKIIYKLYYDQETNESKGYV